MRTGSESQHRIFESCRHSITDTRSPKTKIKVKIRRIREPTLFRQALHSDTRMQNQGMNDQGQRITAPKMLELTLLHLARFLDSSFEAQKHWTPQQQQHHQQKQQQQIPAAATAVASVAALLGKYCE